MHKPWSLVALLLALAGAAAVGCSSNSSSNAADSGAAKPCNENGGSCPDGQTCWPQSASTFACLNAGAGKAGDSCQNSPGTPTCGHGLACLQQAAAGGTCVPYCDPTNPAEACPSGAQCTTAVLGGASGPSFDVCVGPMSVDGGSDGGSSSGGSDAASSSDGGEAGASDAAAD